MLVILNIVADKYPFNILKVHTRSFYFFFRKEYITIILLAAGNIIDSVGF